MKRATLNRRLPCGALACGLAVSLLLTGALSLIGCGGGRKSEAQIIHKQSAADEILRVSEVWTAVLPEKGILSPPSPINVFHKHWKSELTLNPTGGTERLVVEETVQLRAGGEIQCSTTFQHPVQVRYGHKQGEAAVEVLRPALAGTRTCDAVHPEGPLEEPATRALFVLRSDNLVALSPPLEKRRYLPRALP